MRSKGRNINMRHWKLMIIMEIWKRCNQGDYILACKYSAYLWKAKKETLYFAFLNDPPWKPSFAHTRSQHVRVLQCLASGITTHSVTAGQVPFDSFTTEPVLNLPILFRKLKQSCWDLLTLREILLMTCVFRLIILHLTGHTTLTSKVFENVFGNHLVVAKLELWKVQYSTWQEAKGA